MTIPVSTATAFPVITQDEKVPNPGSSAMTVTAPGVTAGYSLGFQPNGGLSVSNTGGPTGNWVSGFTPNNLWAQAEGNTVVATINQLRLAFQIQKLYERDARGGTRYIEILKSHFGVTSPDCSFTTS